MVQLQRVGKVYRLGPVRIQALADVSFRVGKGEFAILTGPSGAGKTTLLRLLYREEVPSEGEIQVAGFDVTALRRAEVPMLRRAIGIVFQDAKLLPGRTAYENIAFGLRVLGVPRREITPRVFQALKAVGLSARAQALPAQLSLGEQQRVALARALAKEPALLLADEPTGSLDEAVSLEVLDLFHQIWQRGTTILLATHSRTLASQLKRRTLVLESGRLVKDEGG
ncbi:MAG: ATP-binding cassette domain-containing protein [Candidatus Rokubacteria bacterium]|nr:ATP-binding cassette domain-containing protein [Candidatus Rokubacteria bacterium]